jgi:hypothetical protein
MGWNVRAPPPHHRKPIELAESRLPRHPPAQHEEESRRSGRRRRGIEAAPAFEGSADEEALSNQGNQTEARTMTAYLLTYAVIGAFVGVTFRPFG